MKETHLIRKFNKLLDKHLPDRWNYKIPDTLGLGGLRPFDLILIVEGMTCCLEFKVKNRPLTDFQRRNLRIAKENGAYTAMVDEKNWKDVADEIINSVNFGPGGTK